MFIGEGPGEQEAESGIPFTGPAGQVFQDITEDLGILLKDVYITNVVKHRPPKNRNPSRKEQLICGFKHLLIEIKLVEPQVIVCLGRVPAEALHLLMSQAPPKGRLKGTSFRFPMGNRMIPVYNTWHPAYALYQKTPHTKEKIIGQIRDDILRAWENQC